MRWIFARQFWYLVKVGKHSITLTAFSYLLAYYYVSIVSFGMQRMIVNFLSSLKKLKPTISARSTDARL